MFLLISYIKKIDIYFDIYTQIKKHTIILSCKKEKVIFLQMGNMKSNLSNNVLDSCYYKSLIYLPAIFQLFLLCNITIVNKRTKENTEWENIIHSKLQPLLFFLAKKKSFHKIIVLIIQYEIVATNCKCIFNHVVFHIWSIWNFQKYSSYSNQNDGKKLGNRMGIISGIINISFRNVFIILQE